MEFRDSYQSHSNSSRHASFSKNINVFISFYEGFHHNQTEGFHPKLLLLMTFKLKLKAMYKEDRIESFSLALKVSLRKTYF